MRKSIALYQWIGIAVLMVLTSCTHLQQTGHLAQTSAPHSSLRIVRGLEEPLLATGATSKEEDQAITVAITAFQNPEHAGDISAFEAFITDYPDSHWQLSVLTNLGIIYYREGFFSRALSTWEHAWESGRHATEPRAKALADRALGELARMHARVGHAEALEQIFADIGDRPVSGSATEMLTGAKEGLWQFKNEPGMSYLCGPMALKNVLISLNADEKAIALMDKQRSGPHGFNLAQVAALAKEAGLDYQLVYREVGQPVPVPSVVNWKLHHYAAIIAAKDGRYHLKDPTFSSGDAWITQDAIDSEGSGYYLVPADTSRTLPWRLATAEEARQVYGMGQTSNNQPDSTTPCDDDKNGNKSGGGMCVANAKTMVVSLSLYDAPVGYRPPIGPSSVIRLSYHQREANQPAVFSFFNVSPKWTMNVLSWVQDNPSFPGNSVLRYVAGGGSINYAVGYSYNTDTGEFPPERQSQAVLVRIPATGDVTSYELRNPDGSKQIFAHPDGAVSYPRRMFLTQMVDSAGNALTMHYDDQLRLTSVTDATERDTTFSYGHANDPLLVTQVTDPFGRHADLTYDASGRLSSITDVIGLTSAFTYDAAGLVNSMTTPYGTSRFNYGNSANNGRYLETTDPLGFTDRVEFRHTASGVPFNEPVIPQAQGLRLINQYLNYRNTFYWDKNMYPVTHTDYTKAYMTHWLHNPIGQTSPIIESTKSPLEGRVWRTYPNQSASYFEGSAATPTTISRVLDDGSSQITRMSYNPLGKPLTIIDPEGRETRFTYAENNIDVVQVEQKTSDTAYETLAQLTYNTQHVPLTYRDAAGQLWTFTYNAAGQILSETNPLNETTRYSYDEFGYLTQVTNANNQIAMRYSYDDFGRVETEMDSEGHTVRYTYDDFDRVTHITYPDDTFYHYEWDKLDRVAMTDRLGRTTRYSYDANRRMTSETDAEGNVTRYDYYPNGTLKSLTDGNGNVTQWQRDLQSRVTAKTYADGTSMTYDYEQTISRVASMTDALNQRKDMSYALDNRLTEIAYSDAIHPTPTVRFVWDAVFPRMTSMEDGNGLTQFTYHPVGSLGALKMAGEDGAYLHDAITYSYDALGRVINQRIHDADDSRSYDAIGRMIGQQNALGDFSLSYQGETSQLTDLELAGSPIQTQWNYDDNLHDRRLTSIQHYGVARNFDYLTRPENLIDRITENVSDAPVQTWNYQYDKTDRITQADTLSGEHYSYAYDGADNIISIQTPAGSQNFTPNNVNQISDAEYSYDALGNRLGDSQRHYQWDAENRLIAISYNAAPTRQTTFRYDGMSRRTAIIEINGTSRTETRYSWCGETLCQARDVSDTVTRLYYPQGEVRPLGNTKLYYATDHLGSVRDVLAAPNGARVAAYDYDAYGNPIRSAGRISVDFRYAGMFYHQASGVYLTHYRGYDSATGRWLSRDPINEEGGINLYGYVGGNPISWIDQLGLSKKGNKGDGSASGKNTSNPYKHCRDVQGKPNKIKCKRKRDGKWVELQKPADWPERNNNQNRDSCGDTCRTLAGGGAVLGGGYLFYRCGRMIPSLFPPLWWTIPGNLVAP